nr:MAG TPA: hypothetical protein [Caudoviricetes sp.]
MVRVVPVVVAVPNSNFAPPICCIVCTNSCFVSSKLLHFKLLSFINIHAKVIVRIFLL